MTETLLEAAATESGEPEGAATPDESVDGRPAGLPDKFWDADGGTVRTEALAKSYLELERKLGGLAGRGVPDGPDGYEITLADDLVTPDPEVNARLHAAGFTQDQVQLVYDLALERLRPAAEDLAAEMRARGHIERLVTHFDGEDKWREASRQISAWGRAHLPPEAFEALASSYEGIVALQRMMDHGEPGLVGGGTAGADVSEAQLKEAMRDPRYWRDRDPATVAQVRDGFRRLYPD